MEALCSLAPIEELHGRPQLLLTIFTLHTQNGSPLNEGTSLYPAHRNWQNLEDLELLLTKAQLGHTKWKPWQGTNFSPHKELADPQRSYYSQ